MKITTRMALHPNLARSLRGRRNIILPDNRTQEALVGRVQLPTHRPGGNRSLSTNVAGASLPQTPNTGRGVPRHQTRDYITPSSLSLGTQPVYQPSSAQTEHSDSVHLGLSHLQLLQRPGNYTPVSGQGPMTVGNESASHPQTTPHSSAPPSIVIQSHDQQQGLLLGPSLSQSVRRQLSFSAVEPFNQYPFSIDQQRNNIHDRLPEVQLLRLEAWRGGVQNIWQPTANYPQYHLGWYDLVARVDESVYNSSIYKDALPRLLQRVDWGDFVHSCPPGYTTFTTAGFNSNGGSCIQLRLRNRYDQIVDLELAVVDREAANRTEIRGVEVVLCQNYFIALNSRQNMPIGVERQMANIGHPNEGHQWPIPSQSQNAINPTENPGYGYASPVWPQPGNQMESIPIPPQQYFPNTVSSTSQSGSAPNISSTTTPDVPMGGSMVFSQYAQPNTSWQQPDKAGA